MKATLWLCSLVTTMLTQSIYASPVINYQYALAPKSLYRENVLTELKRTKPSLSIVNPLDVLRQRLLLEIARRQMRENSKQVEKNRLILKTVGKRTGLMDYDLSLSNDVAEGENDIHAFRMPELRSQYWPWTRIHRNVGGGGGGGYPKFDIYHEMDLRNDKHKESEDNLDLIPNRTEEDPSVQAATVAEYENGEDEDKNYYNNKKSTGLNI